MTKLPYFFNLYQALNKNYCWCMSSHYFEEELIAWDNFYLIDFFECFKHFPKTLQLQQVWEKRENHTILLTFWSTSRCNDNVRYEAPLMLLCTKHVSAAFIASWHFQENPSHHVISFYDEPTTNCVGVEIRKCVIISFVHF